MSPILPAIPGGPSRWILSQWNHKVYIQPGGLKIMDPATRDPRLGLANYAFSSSDEHSRIRIYRDRQLDAWVYELFERDGTLTDFGGTNVFLATDTFNGATTFDGKLTYSFDAKIPFAMVSYRTTEAKLTGAVLSQAFSGFVLKFNDIASGSTQAVFLQVRISLSRPLPSGPVVICSLKGSGVRLLYSPAFGPPEPPLPYRSDAGPLRHFTYSMNAFLEQMLAKPYSCSGRTLEWSAAAHDMRNWRITGFYIGLETQATDLRKDDGERNPQGEVAMALQIANVKLVRTPN